MSVERKQFATKVEKKKEDKVDNKKLKRGFKVESLQDAIVEGKLLAPVGSEIVVNRFRNGKEVYSICTIKEIQESGLINTWDETLQQWFAFPITQAPKITKLFVEKK